MSNEITQYPDLYSEEPFSWADKRWLMHYSKVKAFVEEQGHDRISFYDEEWKATAHWLSLQRTLYNRGELKPERVALLEKLPIRLSQVDRLEEHEIQWQKFFEQLKEYQQTYGHLNVPSTTTTHRSLAVWIMNQRALYKRGELLSHRQRQLEDLGFSFVIRQHSQRPSKGYQWEDYIQAFKRFKEEYHHVLMKSSYMMGGIPLGSWVHNLRTLRLRGGLTALREQELTALGFSWYPAALRWQYKYEELKLFYEREGHVNVPYEHLEREYLYAGKSLNVKLGHWLEKQRQAFKEGTLSSSEKELLEKFPIDWRLKGERSFSSHWHRQLEKLCQLEDVNFFTNDKNHPYFPLCTWSKNQRNAYRKGELSVDRIQALESVGFIWDLKETNYEKKWDANLRAWKELFDLHSETLRHVLRAEHPTLFRWAETQRVAFRQNTLSPQRKQKLIEAGFEGYAQRVRSGWYEEGND